MAKGTEIKAADYPIENYYDGNEQRRQVATSTAGMTTACGTIYKQDLTKQLDGLTHEKTVNGWTNLKRMVYDYENVVYYMSDADRVLPTTACLRPRPRKGAALPTADAPHRDSSRLHLQVLEPRGPKHRCQRPEGKRLTNLVANWEKIPDPTKENIEFNGKDTVYVKCDIYGTHNVNYLRPGRV